MHFRNNFSWELACLKQRFLFPSCGSECQFKAIRRVCALAYAYCTVALLIKICHHRQLPSLSIAKYPQYYYSCLSSLNYFKAPLVGPCSGSLQALNCDNEVIHVIATLNRDSIGMILSKYCIPTINVNVTDIENCMWRHFADIFCENSRIFFY